MGKKNRVLTTKPLTAAQQWILDEECRFGAVVQDMRKARGWTQAELAYRLSSQVGWQLDQSAVSKIENGQYATIGHIVGLASVFGVPVASFLYYALEPTVADAEALSAASQAVTAGRKQLDIAVQEYTSALVWQREVQMRIERGARTEAKIHSVLLTTIPDLGSTKTAGSASRAN